MTVQITAEALKGRDSVASVGRYRLLMMSRPAGLGGIAPRWCAGLGVLQLPGFRCASPVGYRITHLRCSAVRHFSFLQFAFCNLTFRRAAAGPTRPGGRRTRWPRCCDSPFCQRSFSGASCSARPIRATPGFWILDCLGKPSVSPAHGKTSTWMSGKPARRVSFVKNELQPAWTAAARCQESCTE